MRRILIGLFFLFFSGSLNAQDLIVTYQNDSINCLIIKEDRAYVVYEYMDTMFNDTGKASINRGQVKTIIRRYYQESYLPEAVRAQYTFSRWRLGVVGGYSRRLAPNAETVPVELNDYASSLKNGLVLGLDVTYFLTRISGIGINYTRFTTSNSGDYILYDPAGQEIPVETFVSDDIKMTYIGPTYAARIYTKNNKNAFVFTFSMGYLHYLNAFTALQSGVISANALGTYSEACYDLILKDIAVGFGVGLGSGTFSNFEIEDDAGTITSHRFPEGEVESLLLVDFTLTFRLISNRQ